MPSSLATLTAEQAAQHLQNRILARASTKDFAGYIEVPGRPLTGDPDCELFHPIETNLARHHQLICDALDWVSATPNGRLMILAPPGAAKSTFASVVFPSRYLGTKAGRRLIQASYGSDLAAKMGRRTRSILKQPRYERLFGCTLSPESKAADRFSLTNGSEYMATGMLGSVTGNRCDGLLIDDPLRGRMDANSETIRDNIWDAYVNDLLTRLLPGGWVVLVLTHWHEDDVAGRILPSDWQGDSGDFDGRDGMRWRVLCFQAKCETRTDPLGRQIGEYFWPEWFGPDHWPQFERDPYVWNSLYQQRPRPLEGGFFQESMLLVDGEPVEPPVKADVVFAVMDTAMKTGKSHDGTGVVFFSYRRRRNNDPPYTPQLTILDWHLMQVKASLLIDMLPWIFQRLNELARQYRASGTVVHVEDKASGIVLLQQAQDVTAKLAAEGLPYIDVVPIKSYLSSRGKNARGVMASGYIHSGDVKIAREAYELTVEFHQVERNHLLHQFTSFDVSSADQGEDDLLDCIAYGTIIALDEAYARAS